MAFTAYRRLGYLGAAKETPQGTPVAPAKFFKFLRESFVASQDFGHYRDPNNRDITFTLKEKFGYAGSFQTFLYSDEGAALLTWALGADAVSGASDPWTHTITLADNLPYLTVEAGFFEDLTASPTISGLIDRVTDCKIGSLQIDAETGKPVLLTADLVGVTSVKQATPATVTYADALANGPAVFHQGVFTITGPSDAATLQGQVQKFSMKCNQNLQPVFANGLVAIGIVEQAREFEFNMSVVFSGPSIYQLAYYGTASGTVPSATLGTGTFDALFTVQAAPLHTFDLNMAALTFTVVKLEINPDAQVAVAEIVAKPRKSGATLPLEVIVKNAVSVAY